MKNDKYNEVVNKTEEGVFTWFRCGCEIEVDETAEESAETERDAGRRAINTLGTAMEVEKGAVRFYRVCEECIDAVRIEGEQNVTRH